MGLFNDALNRREIRQAEASQKYLLKFLEAYDRVRFVDALAEDLRFRPEASEPFEQGIDDAARMIGLSSQRPEKLYGEGPDNLWHMFGDRFAVIECKNGVQTQDGIAKKDLGQLQQSMTWFGRHYGNADATPVIIHPHGKAGATASVPPGARVMKPQDLQNFNKALKSFVHALAADESAIRDVERIASLLASFNLQADLLIDSFTREIE